jgi:hypothetical protein
MQNKEDLFGFFSDKFIPQVLSKPSPNTIRIYAQNLYLWKEFLPELEKWLKNFGLEVLPSTKISETYKFDYSTPNSDIALLMIRELETTREPQWEWYKRTTEMVRANANHTLIITISNLPPKITKERKQLYEKSIPHITVEYFDVKEWFVDKNEEVTPILSCIKNFIMQFQVANNTNGTTLNL